MSKINKQNKINLTIIFGGKSAEHEVSILSTKSVVQAIDKDKYNISLIGIDKQGRWLSVKEKDLLKGDLQLNALSSGKSITEEEKINNDETTYSATPTLLKQTDTNGDLDVVFPILHGPLGEDGVMQGFLKILDIAFVGPDILGSAINMDKDVSKRLLKEAGLPVAKFLVFNRSEKNNISFADIEKDLGLPVFVKPANLGSSVGISKVQNMQDFKRAIKEAFKFDNKIIIEEAIQGKEIECAVLGNDNPQASVPGEIIPTHDFYSYDAKYFDADGAKMAIPANIPEDIAEKIREMAVQAFKVLCCEGMGRVDFFLTDTDEIFVNEINTIPGFTPISMYPKLWEASGLNYSELINKLIQLALERKEKQDRLRTNV